VLQVKGAQSSRTKVIRIVFIYLSIYLFDLNGKIISESRYTNLSCIYICMFKVGFLKSEYDEYDYSTHLNLRNLTSTEVRERVHVTGCYRPSDRARGRIRSGEHQSFCEKNPELLRNQPAARKKISGRRAPMGRWASTNAALDQVLNLGRGACKGKRRGSRG
jgi:hypothetical protein